MLRVQLNRNCIRSHVITTFNCLSQVIPLDAGETINLSLDFKLEFEIGQLKYKLFVELSFSLNYQQPHGYCAVTLLNYVYDIKRLKSGTLYD